MEQTALQPNFRGKLIEPRKPFPYIFFVLNMSIVIYGIYKIWRAVKDSIDTETKQKMEKLIEKDEEISDLPSRSRTPGLFSKETSEFGISRSQTPNLTLENTTRRNALEVPDNCTC